MRWVRVLVLVGCGGSSTPSDAAMDGSERLPDAAGTELDATAHDATVAMVRDASTVSDALPLDAAREERADAASESDATIVPDDGGARSELPNGAACGGGGECASTFCEEGECVSPPGTHPDIVRVIDVVGDEPRRGWSDSYSVGDACYCESTFDHNIADILVDTPVGPRRVRDVCETLGPGPGSEGRPLYNDIQCGNGPPNDAGDEDDCPGRVDLGREGCAQIGPRWRLEAITDRL